MTASIQSLVVYLGIVFAPIVTVVIVACLLSLFGIKPPKKGGGPSWFPDEKEW